MRTRVVRGARPVARPGRSAWHGGLCCVRLLFRRGRERPRTNYSLDATSDKQFLSDFLIKRFAPNFMVKVNLEVGLIRRWWGLLLVDWIPKRICGIPKVFLAIS